MNYKCITDKKNHLNNLAKKEQLLEIKQDLFRELANKSFRMKKYNENDENMNNYNEKSKYYEESKHLENHNNYHQNLYQENNNIYNRRKKIISTNRYNSKSWKNKNNSLKNIKSNSLKNINSSDDDLMYIITKEPNYSQNKLIRRNYKYNENIISHLALPFCHYHKYNVKLPKKYTCNFKNCSCCKFKDSYYNEYTKETSRDYIYPSIDKTSHSNRRYNNVLEKYMAKYKKINLKKLKTKKSKSKNKKKYVKKKVEDNFNKKINESNKKININLRKQNIIEEKKNSNSLNQSKSEEISDMSLNFQKPDSTNLKIPKKKLEELNESSSKDYSLDVPDDINIKDEKDLKNYKNLVDEKNRKSKIHFSVTYYQKLNKSFRVYCNNNKKRKSPYKVKSKEKKIEFLRCE